MNFSTKEKDILSNRECYDEASSYLNKTLKHGIKPGQNRIKALLKALDDPHQSYETVLVTGTNGKTSTAAIISAILESHGFKTGLYISPHLHSYCERISFGGYNISENDLNETLKKIKPIIAEVDKETGDPLTNFEILTALAFYYFRQQKADCAVLEVGMGARFDATCLTRAKVSVITNIELDHMDYLGPTINEIAVEKSFVIKKRHDVVVGRLSESAKEVINKRADEFRAKVFSFDNDFLLKKRRPIKSSSQSIDIMGLYSEYEKIKINSIGQNQAENTVIATVAAELFIKNSLVVDKLRIAVRSLHFFGRLELISKKPMILVDGAHNTAAARRLKKTLTTDYTFKKLIFILAIYNDKDYKNIIKELQSIANIVIFSENSSQRSLKAATLAKAFSGSKFFIKTPLTKAIEVASKKSSPNDLICITGSLATVADARCILGKRR